MIGKSINIPAAPPLLTGAALLFWGWQNNCIVNALVMAVLLEAHHVLTLRFRISGKEFNQLSDATAVVFFFAVLYIFSEDGSKGIFTILSINPYVMYLLVLLQAYSRQGKVPLSALFMSMRKSERANPDEAVPAVDLSYPYFLLCLLAAGAGKQTELWFFIILCLLIAGMLASFRPQRYPLGLWLASLCIAISLSYAGQAGILTLRDIVRANMMQLFEQYVWRYRDPDRTSTAIGSIGRFKLSDRIVLRAATPRRLQQRLYLREASYDLYGQGVWSNSNNRFEPIAEIGQTEVWELNQARATDTAIISSYFIREAEVIPLPLGSQRIYDVPAIQLARTAANTVNMDIYDGWVKYSVDYVADAILDAPPADGDLYVPKNYRTLFGQLAAELQLAGQPERQQLAMVEEWFAAHFNYTLQQDYWYAEKDFLQQFLYEHRKGHCEYFATATALLLRAAGIPARYAVGYVVDEYSPWEAQYVARARDAHSWVLAYVDGDWQLVDTTPGLWGALEAENASVLEPLWDAWSWLSYRYALWKAKDALKEENRTRLLLLLIPLLMYLSWRLYGKQGNSKDGNNKATEAMAIPGGDSAFYQIIDLVRQRGFEVRPGETLAAWCDRYQQAYQEDHLQDDKHDERHDHKQGYQQGKTKVDMQAALALHYQYRFDPAADHRLLKHQLETACCDILRRLRG